MPNFENRMYNLDTDRDQYFYLGKVIKTHGYRGELVILLETEHPEDYHELDVIFLNIDRSLVPWFIEEIRIRDDMAIVKLEDISEPEHARTFMKKEVYLPADKHSKAEGADFHAHEIIGFDVTDRNHGGIGKVEEVLDRPKQQLIRIMKGETEILVPLTDEIIHKIDREKKLLHIIAPDGLIDLYLD